jgi:hypothetical protein
MFAATLLFFVAFFLAVFTQYRAENSVVNIFIRCWNTNRNWQISEYNPNHDLERQQQEISLSRSRFVPKLII